MSNVTPINGDPFTKETLEKLLKECEQGTIQSVAIAVVYKDGCVTTDYSFEGETDVFKLYGTVQHLSNRVYDEQLRDI